MKNKILTFYKESIQIGYKTRLSIINICTKSATLLSSLLIFCLIFLWLPDNMNYTTEISLFTAIIVTIIAFIPIQEMIELILKKKFLSEYLFDDPLTLKNARRRFEIGALISNVFPDMVKLSGSVSGRLAVLNPDSTYDIYVYSKAKQRKVKLRNVVVNTKFINFLKDKKQGVSISECLLYPDINEDFMQLKSSFIFPFLFRNKVFGFLAVADIPSEQDKGNLTVLASKAALAVYNHILSSEVVINKKYKREFEVANKIEDQIFTNQIPDILNFKFKTIQKNSTIMQEFFKNNDGSRIFALTVLKKGNRMGSGLVLSSLLGTIYSQTLLKKKHSIHSVKETVNNTLNNISWKEGHEMIIGNFFENSQEIIFYQVGTGFKLVKETDLEKNLITIGYKNPIAISKNPLFITYKGKKVLSIESMQ
ncbi:MAG: hypothetical protein KDK90_04540 [Leptospiraceae bacterium]|nr:hypothetical protein [Leptospiraceae bacterium]